MSEPTRHGENEESNLLDLILTSEEGMVHNLAYHPPFGESDHYMPYLHITLLPTRSTVGTVFKVLKEKKKETNYENMKALILDQDWRRMVNAGT